MLHDRAIAPWRLTLPKVGRNEELPAAHRGRHDRPQGLRAHGKSDAPRGSGRRRARRGSARAALGVPRRARLAAEPLVPHRERAQAELGDSAPRRLRPGAAPQSRRGRWSALRMASHPRSCARHASPRDPWPPTELPCSGPRHLPCASSASSAAAWARARSRVKLITQCKWRSSRSSRLKYISVNSTQLTLREANQRRQGRNVGQRKRFEVRRALHLGIDQGLGGEGRGAELDAGGQRGKGQRGDDPVVESDRTQFSRRCAGCGSRPTSSARARRR